MKPHLPLTLLSALLTAFSASAVSTTYLADGVDEADLVHSERFYDVGKGHYWTWTGETPYKGANSLYQQYRNFSYLGDLATRMSGTLFSVNAFSNLTNDGQTCGYQVPANMIQYWLSYYGPFYTGSEPLAYGYTYSRDYLDKLGGTQSLDVGMLFYDSWQDMGNSLGFVGKWYFCGVAEPGMMKPGASAGGFFADYFSTDDIVYLTFDAEDTKYTNYRPLGAKSFSHELVKGFGMEEEADGSFAETRPGQLVYLSLLAGGKNEGHAITCYGFETNADGMVTSLKVTNSDDRLYSLFTLYVKENAKGYMALYTDAACTQLWEYANTTWQINGLEYINTPEHLVDLYKLYAADDTELVWTGLASGWSADFMPATTDALPGKETGWAVQIAGNSYHSYYSEDRPVCFDDHAASGEVHITTPVSRSTLVPKEMHLHNAALDYVFIGESGDRLMPEKLVIDGTGSATFRNLQFSTNRIFYETYTLNVGQGARLSANDISVNLHGTLELSGGSVSAQNGLSFGKNATLRVSEISTLSGAITMQGGSVFDCVLSSDNTATALLSVTGSLTLGGTVKLEIEGDGLTAGNRYRVCTVSSGTITTSNFFTEHGSLSFSDNTLWLTYREVSSYAWSGGSGQWSSTKLGNAAHDTVHADIEFNGGSGTITLIGQVAPHHLSLHGGTYTFAGTGASINCEGYVNLDGSADLTLDVPITSQGIILEDDATLTLETGRNSTLSYLSATEHTHLNFRGAVTYDLEDAGVLAGAISVGAGTTVDFRLAHDEYLEGAVTAVSSASSIRFENTSTTRDIIIYEVGDNMEHFQGTVFVGRDGAARHTTLSLDSAPGVGTYNVAGGSALLINDSCAINTAVIGAGTLVLGRGAEFAVRVTDGHTSFANTLALDVQGTAEIGTDGDRLTRSLTSDLSVSGHLSLHVAGGSTLAYDRVTLDGGSYTYHTTLDLGDVTQTIEQLHIGKGGGSFLRHNEATSAYYNYAGITRIGSLTGSGKLTLSGDHFVQMTYYSVNGVGEEGFSGDIHVDNVGSYGGDSYHLTVLELGAGVYGGSAMLANNEDDRHSRTALGITGDVTLRGLQSEEWGEAYLYSGYLKSTKLDTKTPSPEGMVTAQQHTLTLDTASDYHFAGEVLGPVNLVKKGNGTQSFRGDMSGFKGSVSVSGGVLAFSHDVSLASALVESTARLRGDESLNIEGALVMNSGELVAKALTTTTASFSGQSAVQADSIRATGAWTLNLGMDNLHVATAEITSLNGAGTLTLRGGLHISYNPNAVASATYKLLTLSSDYSSQLSGLTIRRNGTLISLGAAGSSPLYLQQASSGAYDLILEITDGTAPLPREEYTTLYWQTASGIWSVGSGELSGDWAGEHDNANFHNADEVVFARPATISVQGAVSPSAISVTHGSGEVVLHAGNAQATITGSTSLSKIGAGDLTINTANSYTGGTSVKNGTLTIGNVLALGTGEVSLSGGTLNTGAYAVKNAVTATGGTFCGKNYAGALTIRGDVTLGSALSAGSLNLNSGTLHGDVNTSKVTTLNARGGKLDGALTLDGGTLNLSRQPLEVSGALTLSGITRLSLTSYTSVGTYTLISAGSVIGSTEMLAYATESNRRGYDISIRDNTLMLTVTQLANNLTWTAASGTWAAGSVIGGETYVNGDTVTFANTAAATVTLSGMLSPGGITVQGAKDVTFKADVKNPGVIAGSGDIVKNGNGVLTLNNGNSYTGVTVLNAGTLKATGNTSFGGSSVIVNGGTLDMGMNAVDNAVTVNGTAVVKGSKYTGHLSVNGNLLKTSSLSLAQDADLLGGTISGVLSGTAGVTINGDVTYDAKQTYKGLTTLESGSLTLTSAAGIAGSIIVKDGVLTLPSGGTSPLAAKGLSLAKGQVLEIQGGLVKGDVTAAAGAAIELHGGTLQGTPTLTGGTLRMGHATAMVELNSVQGGTVSFGSQNVALKGKGIIYSGDALTVASGSITFNTSKDYSADIYVTGGTLTAGMSAANVFGGGTVHISGGTMDFGMMKEQNAEVELTGSAVIKGSKYTGHLSVNGNLLKTSSLSLAQDADLLGGTISGVLSGTAGVTINGDVTYDAKQTYKGLTTLESGSLTLTSAAGIAGSIIVKDGVLTLPSGGTSPLAAKGLSLAKGQVLDIQGGLVKGDVTAAAGATIELHGGTLQGTPTLTGGTLRMGHATAMVELNSVQGGTVSFGSQNVALKGKGIIYSGDALTVSSGSVTFNASSGYSADIDVTGGTLTAGMSAANVFGGGTIHVSGGTMDFGMMKEQNAEVELTGSAVIKGSKYTGHLSVNGNLLKTSSLSLAQDADLLGGTISGVLSGTAGVTINGEVTYDAKQTYKGLTTLESGSLTLTSAAGIAGSITVKDGVLTLPSGGTSPLAAKGLSLAKGQVLDIQGGLVKGDVTAAAGATIELHGGTLQGTPTLTGGTLRVGHATAMVELNSVQGGTVSFGSQNVALKGKGIIYSGDSLTVSSGSVTFNASSGYSADIDVTGGTLTAGMTATDVFGSGTIHVSGGTLDFGMMKEQNAEVELTGSAVIKGSKYTGHLSVNGNLLKTSSLSLAQDADLLGGTISGVLSGTAGVTINGDVTYDAKQTYKGLTTLESGSLTLTSAAGIAGSIIVKDGVLTLPSGGTSPLAAKGLSLAKGQVLEIQGGLVKGDVTAAAGATIELYGGTLQGTPTLTGGTLRMGHATAMVELNSVQGGTVSFGSQNVALKGKGIIYSGDALTVSSGSVTFNAASGYSADIDVTGGTLTAGMTATDVFGSGTIHVSGGTMDFGMMKEQNAEVELTGSAVIKGSKYTGHLSVNGNLLKTSSLSLAQDADLLGGTISGVLSGTAGVTINGDVTYDAKQTYKGLTTLESGSLTLTSAAGIAGSIIVKDGVLTLPSGGTSPLAAKGLSLAKGQVLEIQGGLVKGDVTAAAGATIGLHGGTLQGTPTLTGGTLRMGHATAMVELNSVQGGTVSFGSQTVALKGKGIIYSSDSLTVASGSITFNTSKDYSADIYVTGGTLTAGMSAANVFGGGTVHISGGTLDFGMMKEQNATVELTGAAIIKGSKYTGALTVNGNLLKTSSLSLAQDADLLGGTISGVLSGTAGVTINGDVTYDAKQTYKGLTTLESGSLTLTSAAGIAGSIIVKDGVLTLPSGGTSPLAAKGLSLAKGQVLEIQGGLVKGDVTAAAGATIELYGGTLQGTPTLTGGTIELGSSTTQVELTCALGGTVSFGSQNVALKGKGIIHSDALLTILSGNVTVNALHNYTDALEVQGGTLTLGRDTVTNDIQVTGTGAVNNGTAHHGNITVNGSLDKGTTIKLLDAAQHVTLNGTGAVQGTISGSGTVNVNAHVDVSNATLSASTIRVNSGGILTNTKGITLARNQQYALHGGTVNLNGKALATAANSTLSVMRSSSVSGNLTLGGGELVMSCGAKLSVSGLLTLGTATQLTLSGNWSAGDHTLISFGTIKLPLRGTLDDFFKVGQGMHLTDTGSSIVLTLADARNTTLTTAAETLAEAEALVAVAAAPRAAAAPTLCAAAEELDTPQEIVELVEASAAPAPMATAPAPLPLVSPVADALVQADHGIVEATRAFTDSISGHRDGSTLIDKGAGSVWVTALGHIARHGSQGEHNGADHNITGAAFGVEHRIGETGAAGLAVGRTQNRIGTTGLSHLRQETAHVALYGQKSLRHGFTADVTAAWGDTDTRADIGGERLTFTQHSAELSARLTHSRALSDDTLLRSFGALSYDATDSGSSADVRTGSVQNLRAEAGVGFNTAVTTQLSLFGEAALMADAVRHNPTADIVGYRMHGANPGRFGLRASIGGTWQVTDSWSAHASYSFETEARTTSHRFTIGASKGF